MYVSHSRFRPRNVLVVKEISSISRRYRVGLPHYRLRKLEQPFDRSGSCFGQSAAAQKKQSQSAFAQHFSNLLKHIFMNLESLEKPPKQQEKHAVLWISWAHSIQQPSRIWNIGCCLRCLGECFKRVVGPAFLDPVLYPTVDAFKRLERYGVFACYSSTNRLFTSFMEKKNSPVKLARRRAALDRWIGLICGKMALMISKQKELYTSVTGRRYLLTGRDCPYQTRQTDFDVWEGRSAGFLV